MTDEVDYLTIIDSQIAPKPRGLAKPKPPQKAVKKTSKVGRQSTGVEAIPINIILHDVMKLSTFIGVDRVRWESDAEYINIYMADVMEKTVFVDVSVVNNVGIAGSFSVKNGRQLVQVLANERYPAEIKNEKFSSYERVDQGDPKSKLTELIEDRPSWITIGRYQHKLDSPIFAPKVILKNEPNWAIELRVDDSKIFDQFIRYSKYMKGNATRFRARPIGRTLQFEIFDNDGNVVEIDIGECLGFDRPWHCTYVIESFLRVIYAAKSITITDMYLQICSVTGLMRASFSKGDALYQLIIPGHPSQ